VIEQTGGDGRQRYHRLRELTGRLRSLLAGREETMRQQVSLCHKQVEANQVLGRRDYAFCFYPEALLREFCLEFLE
jgi:hypothetical protein